MLLIAGAIPSQVPAVLPPAHAQRARTAGSLFDVLRKPSCGERGSMYEHAHCVRTLTS
jgi:hypothetical protein